MRLATASGIAGAAAAAAAYLDARFQLRKDVREILLLKRETKEWENAVGANKASLWYQFEQQVESMPPSTRCIWSRDGCYTWSETYQQSCRFAKFFLAQGINPGELVATYLQNSPEYMFALLGTWAIGTAPAMINHNLAGDGLIHSLKISRSKVLVVDENVECRRRIEDSRDRIENELGMRIIILDQSTRDIISALDPHRPEDRYRDSVTGKSPIFLLYTSGTTGFPKGSPFQTDRAWFVGKYRAGVQNERHGPNGDTIYVSMPLYHGTGCLNALGGLMTGTSIAIGRKFSTSGFWDDVRDSGATIIVYVGETARYLLFAPPTPRDKDHKVRLMYGNGLRPDVWKKFLQRFGIPEVMEIFNSTEGMLSMNNYCRNEHFADAVGHHGAIWRRIFNNVYIPVKIDIDTGDIWRDPNTGFAKRVSYEEGGEILVTVEDESAFQGYWDAPEATAKRFARDVFAKDDIYYRSGDSLRRTPDGKWYFLDRLGDTFRWKGENCSTTEVAECLGRFPRIKEANVYGVELPAHDGRACCATIYVDPTERASFDFSGLLAHLNKSLPRYAIPLFLRFAEDPSPTMHNNKQNKTQLRREGVEPEKIIQGTAGKNDAMFWLPPKGRAYEPFGEKQWNSLVAGKAKL